MEGKEPKSSNIGKESGKKRERGNIKTINGVKAKCYGHTPGEQKGGMESVSAIPIGAKEVPKATNTLGR